jgi:hypothetical protein
MNIKFAILASIIMLVMSCSSEQVYDSGKAWRLSECDKIADARERARCREEAETAYDEYEQDRKGQPPANP